jgi:hypothetical protein
MSSLVGCRTQKDITLLSHILHKFFTNSMIQFIDCLM